LSYALDSNLLIRSIEENHQQQDEALDAINKLVGRGEDVFLLPQFLYEFWVVATRPTKDNGLGLNTTEAETFLAKFESVFPVKHDTEAFYSEWRRQWHGRHRYERPSSCSALGGKLKYSVFLVPGMFTPAVALAVNFKRLVKTYNFQRSHY